MKTDFPVDIFSITDIEKWSGDFYWPVSEEYYEKMGESLFFQMRSFILSVNDKMVNALLRIQVIYFFLHFCDILHTAKVIEELKKQEHNIVYNSKIPYRGSNLRIGASLYKEIIENGAPFPVVSNKWELKLSNAKGLLKTRYKFLKGELNWKWSNLVWEDKLPIVIFDPCVVLLGHLRHTKKRAIITSTEQWLLGYKDRTLPENFCGLLKDTSTGIREAVDKIAQKFAVPFTKQLSSYVENFSYINLEYTAKLFNHLINNKKLSKPIHLWTRAAGHLDFRLLSEAVRYKGGVVSQFSEVGGVGCAEKVNYIMLLLTTNDRFGVYSINEIPLFKKMVERFPLMQTKEAIFFPAISDESKKLWQLNKDKSFRNKQIREIMFVPSSYQGDSRLMYHFMDLVRLDWEIRLVKILVSMGYKVIYKKHPKGRLRDLPFEPFGDRVKYVYERFQKVMDMADAFIFDTMPSTAMYEAMCTRKPVIFINCNVPKIYPEPLSLLAKRCRIVPAKLDERNRIIVDENELCTALTKYPTEPNYEYLEKYMFPAGDDNSRLNGYIKESKP